MPRLLRVLPFLLLTLPGLAEGTPFTFPESLAGFSAHVGGADFAAGGPIATLLSEHRDIRCDSRAVFEYRDGPAATAGLTGWLSQQELKPRDFERTEQAAVWMAETQAMELLGAWAAPEHGQPGRLEMCQHKLVSESSVEVPGKGIALLLGLIGSLGAAGGRLWNRLRGQRQG